MNARLTHRTTHIHSLHLPRLKESCLARKDGGHTRRGGGAAASAKKGPTCFATLETPSASQLSSFPLSISTTNPPPSTNDPRAHQIEQPPRYLRRRTHVQFQIHPSPPASHKLSQTWTSRTACASHFLSLNLQHPHPRRRARPSVACSPRLERASEQAIRPLAPGFFARAPCAWFLLLDG